MMYFNFDDAPSLLFRVALAIFAFGAITGGLLTWLLTWLLT